MAICHDREIMSNLCPKGPLALALVQVTELSPEVCKTVGFAYPGSNPGPATSQKLWLRALAMGFVNPSGVSPVRQTGGGGTVRHARRCYVWRQLTGLPVTADQCAAEGDDSFVGPLLAVRGHHRLTVPDLGTPHGPLGTAEPAQEDHRCHGRQRARIRIAPSSSRRMRATSSAHRQIIPVDNRSTTE